MATHPRNTEFLEMDDLSSNKQHGHYATSSNGTSSSTASSQVPRRHFGFLQITAFILNACFANSNYFMTPYYTLALVRSKRICLALWAAGGLYTAIGLTLFLEYGTALPYTGGALIYLDRVFPRPKLLATIIFATWFIVFQTTAGMSRQSAQTILSLVTGEAITALDLRLVKFTAITIQTIVCLILYFFKRATFMLNTVFAAYRIMLMFSIFVIGMIVRVPATKTMNDFNVEYPGYSVKNTLSAFVYIIACSQGYETATYVTGEVIDDAQGQGKNVKSILKWSGITAVTIQTVFNVLVTYAMFSVAPYAMLTEGPAQAQSAYWFGQLTFGDSKWIQAACLPATIGSLIFITYTYSRVKQAIAWQRILPGYKVFGRQDIHFESPGGGLLLHWLFTVAIILGLDIKSRALFNGIAVYGYQLMFLALAIGLFRLTPYMRAEQTPDWKLAYLRNKYAMYAVAIVFITFNVATLIVYALPVNQLPRFYWPVGTAVVVAIAFLYWTVLRLLQAKGKCVGLQVYLHEPGHPNIPASMEESVDDSAWDGTRRRMSYKTSGRLRSIVKTASNVKNGVLQFLAY